MVERNRINLLQQRWRGRNTEGPEHHQLVPSQYKGGGLTVKRIQRVWFGGGGKKWVYHQPVPSQYKGGGPTVKGIQRVWFGGGGKNGSIFGFLP